jgi:hypothetical protein
LRQQTARKSNVSMDELKLVVSWQSGGIPSAQLSVQINELMLQGAQFDGSGLADVSRDSPRLAKVPLMHLAWIHKSQENIYSIDSAVSVPLYVTSNRENTVCDLLVPCSGAPSKWILYGTAFFVSDE